MLERFKPGWPDVIADHITFAADTDWTNAQPEVVRDQIVGGIDDGEGLQAMVVAIDDNTDRPDGGTYHITWSLDRGRGRTATESNDVIAQRGWRPLDNPVPIRIIPAQF